jgi:molybdenum cofactor cytidylyltransferase
MQINLIDALGLRGKFCTALSGAGGKTSAMFRLAGSFEEPVFLSTSAHLALDQLGLAEHRYTISSSQDLPAFTGGVPAGISLFCGTEIAARQRVNGLDSLALEHLRQLAGYHAVPLLVEADGSRRLPLKAPAEHEPPIPPFADAVIVCAGLSGLGKALDEDTVFRSALFGQLAGLNAGEPITTQALAKVLVHPQGGLKNIPNAALRGVILNQANTPALRAAAAQLARTLLRAYTNVLIAELNGPGPGVPAIVHSLYRPTAGIVLAAGASSRLGQPKQLLDWRGMPLVRRAALTALAGGLDPVVVVTGAHSAAVTTALDGLPVNISFCENWQNGQSASLKTGLNTALQLRPDLGSALFLLSDQPFVSPELVGAVVDLFAQNRAPAAVPRVDGRRANPALFARELFPALLAIEGDMGGRQVLASQTVATLDWPDPRILLDIDTLEDYQKHQQT